MILKKLFVATIILLSVSTPVFADYFIDAYGVYAGLGKKANLLGGGGAAGINIIDKFSMVYRGMYAVASKKSRYLEDKKFNHMMQMAGFEYVVTIPVVRIGWRNSFMVGYSRTRVDVRDYETNVMVSIIAASSGLTSEALLDNNVFKIWRQRDRGFAIGYWTGLQFDILPYFAPFIDVGLHKSIYHNDLEGKNIFGLHLMFGVRFCFGMGGDRIW